MPYVLSKLTPNLVVSNVERAVHFYCDVLGFSCAMTVPDEPPYAFSAVRSGGVEIFLNSAESAGSEYPAFRGKAIGGTLTMFIDVADVRSVYDALKTQVKIVMPIEKKWYGVRDYVCGDRRLTRDWGLGIRNHEARAFC